MTGLPTALSPWSAELGLFPRDLALQLGRWLPRLAATLGVALREQQEDGEPDGFSGITRRGNYERLLHTEWLLADELPDEFLRRCVEGEHSFHALTRVRAGGSRRCVAVFDCGPDQLGSPRLAHLALLVVIARRARVAGAEFVWGCAHEPEIVHVGLSPATMLALMRARTARDPSPADVAAWRARAGRGVDDLWLIGGQALVTAASEQGPACVVAVDDVLAADRDAIRVTARRTSALPRSVELTLPAGDLAVRLLRDPFETEKARRSGVGATVVVPATLRFNTKGDRLLARCLDGRVVAWHVPNSPQEPSGRARYLSAVDEEILVAVHTVTTRRAVTASLRGATLVLRGVLGQVTPWLFEPALGDPALV